MDRNNRPHSQKHINSVALRKESVDRNFDWDGDGHTDHMSLSARRAWIEIMYIALALVCAMVALRKESVDRNTHLTADRRAGHEVALRKESVDRNLKIPVK